jgi:hypothetical protein
MCGEHSSDGAVNQLPDAIEQMGGEDWLKQLFEFETCGECGGDAKDHEAIPVMGNWFARCRNRHPNDRKAQYRMILGNVCLGIVEQNSDLNWKFIPKIDTVESSAADILSHNVYVVKEHCFTAVARLLPVGCRIYMQVHCWLDYKADHLEKFKCDD